LEQTGGNAISTGAVIAVAMVLWSASVFAHVRWFPVLQYTPGIDVIFLPAGIRLLVLLVGRFWGSVGIALGSAIVCVEVLGPLGPFTIALVSVVTGIGPYLVLLGACRFLSIDEGLRSLKPVHLPILSLCVAA
jgi:hypothetical protein